MNLIMLTSFEKKYNLVQSAFFFALWVLAVSFITSCTSNDKLDNYPFEIDISGPFGISEIIKRNDVVFKDGIHLIDSLGS